MKIYILVILLTFLTLPASTQTWKFTSKIGGMGNEYTTGVTVDKDGNSYIIGNFRHSITLDTISLSCNGSQSIFVAKYNSVGKVVWAKTVATAVDSLLDAVNLNAIASNGSGDIFLTGNYLGNATFFGIKHTSVAASEIFLIKLRNNGDLVWLKTAGGNGVGNYNQNEAYACCTDSFGNCIITGRYFTTATFDTITISAQLPNEFFIAKYNQDGNIVWVKSGGGDFGLHNGLGVACDVDGNVYATGDFFGHMNIDDNTLDAVDAEQKIFIAKFSATGKTLWAKEVGSGGYYGIGSGISVDRNNNAYISGFFRSTIDFGITQLTFNRPIIAYAMLAVKYDTDGNFVWAVKTDGADQNTRGTAICMDSKGNEYITGSFTSNTTFGTTTLTKDSANATFVTKLDPTGAFLWAKQTDGKGDNNGEGIAVGQNGEIVVVGNFMDTVGFDSQRLTSSGGTDIYLAILMDQTNSVKDTSKQIVESPFYPNPVEHIMHFPKKQNIVLHDILGRKVVECKECEELNVEQIPAGSYFINGNLIIVQH